MASLRAKHRSCSVVGCPDEHRSLFTLPSSQELKTRWIHFMYDGNVPANIPKALHVCGNHFASDCFENEGAFNAGFASHLRLKPGSVPTVRDPLSKPLAGNTSHSQKTREVAVQTDPSLKSIGTQLSLRTLQAHVRSEAIQATVSTRDCGVGTASTYYRPPLSSTLTKRPSKRRRLELDDDDDEPLEGSSTTSQEHDVTCDPADSVTGLSKATDTFAPSTTPIRKLAKYIVYESCLMELFEKCPACTQACEVKFRRLGTFLYVEQLCPSCHFTRRWNSQPLIRSTPAGNLHLSAAIYISGASYFKVERIFKAMRLQMFQYDTFRRHARNFIEPAIISTWKTSQDELLQQLTEQVIIVGDMRADSPGCSATYGSYTVMDLKTNRVLDLQVVKSNEVGGSYHMEKEGLKRSLDKLEACGMTLDCVVTDRRPQIQKYLAERRIPHYYDVWHLEKGITKKLELIAKMKDCEKLQKWMKAIKNHIHWTAVSSTTGPERVAKWTSLLNHIQDIHTHEDPLFPQCLHPVRQTRDKSKWLEAGTPAFNKLEKVLKNKRMLKDVEKLSPHHQTPSLKAFHGVVLRFSPKNVVFPYVGMLCRLYLAALYYNENAGRPQATSGDGEPLFKVTFPKGRKGQCVARPVKTEATYHYVDNLMEMILDKVVLDPAPYTDDLLTIPVPPPLCADFDRPHKEEVTAAMVTGFNQAAV